MNQTSKLSFMLLTCLLCMLLFGIWALNYIYPSAGQNEQDEDQLTAEFTRQKRGVQDFRAHIKRKGAGNEKKASAVNGENGWESDSEWENRQKTHQINIVMTNMEDEEQLEHQKDQKVKEALLKMMKLKENKAAPKVRRHFDNAPGLDFRREFASDEPNPYIENLRNRCEQP
ncbi:hypothetical protein KR093_003397 [Drosophila rubida]|uniref:Uncharacterized protein n=1 Tax=Drosophila rubida TaxID=30044 RepID=A0AAD4K9L1_9MUSC|nr:hypothetical protein KR093_003397 [Drosophila rubida]